MKEITLDVGENVTEFEFGDIFVVMWSDREEMKVKLKTFDPSDWANTGDETK